ncbi:MAG: hypothetical protein JRI91_03310 [Deltaproteobacteria bacterium]|nr:hypothetical protein [Deltaproteobacteria bacterium]
MTNKATLFIISTIILLLCCPVTAAESSWQLILDKNGVTVYTKPVKNSVFDEFKGIAVINVNIDVLEMVLRDIPAFPLWMSGCKASPIIEEIDSNNYIFYFVQGLPWPLNDRDTAMKAKADFDRKNGYYSVNFHSIDDQRVPVKDDLIRMKMEGGFVLKYIDNDHTMVTFFIKAYPGGSIPGIIANIFSREIPYETLLGMKNIAQNERYANRPPAK